MVRSPEIDVRDCGFLLSHKMKARSEVEELFGYRGNLRLLRLGLVKCSALLSALSVVWSLSTFSVQP
jgi:uncharacterized ferredoxin-like protein